MNEQIDSRLDVTGMCCPVPLICLAKVVADLKPGQMVEITGNDPVFESTVRDFCQVNGHAVAEVTATDASCTRIIIRIGR